MSSSLRTCIDDIYKAHERIKPFVHKTEIFTSTTFNNLIGRNAFFKSENLQKTGSFKARGALNSILILKEQNPNLLGVVTCSSGNHGQAVAWAAGMTGVKSCVLIPRTAPKVKAAAIQSYGAEVVFCEPNPQSSTEACAKLAKERGFEIVHSSDHYDIIAGQGTMAVELLEQVPDLDAILVSACGGGMISGISIAAKSIKNDIKVFMVEPEGKMAEKCIRSGERLWPNPPKFVDTIADAIILQQLDHLTFPIICDLVEKDVFTLRNEDMIKGMKFMFQHMKIKSMATSNQSDEQFCSFCDPSPIKAIVWCSECDDFLCSDCLKHHKSSKASKNHSTMSLEVYNELPAVAQTLNYHCEDHDEKLDSFCPVHNRPCCIRCSLTSHKECSGVAPITDFILNVKSTPAMLDLEQTLNELGSFVKRVTDDKEENIQEILNRKKEICEEIHKIRKSLNDHLDQLQETLIRGINKTVDDVTLQLGDVKNSLTEIENKTSDVTMEFNKIKEHASDLQTFLSLPHLVSKANDEEENIEKLGSEGKFNRKTIIFTARTDDIIQMKSIGDVGVDDIESNVAYVKEKEKQAQIVGPLTRRTNDRITLKLIKEIDVKVGNRNHIITGCTILDNGKVLFSEYNRSRYTDRVTLNDSKGNFIRTVQSLDPKGSFYDVTSIDTNTIAVSAGTCISIVNIDTHNILHTIKNDRRCYAITHYDDKLYYCINNEGIQRFDLRTKSNQLLIPTKDIGQFSYISSGGNKLFYTSSTVTVRCCDMNGKEIWRFEGISHLRSPRGVVVDNQGFVFVTGEQSGNIVVISPDGNSSKEVYQISNPRSMCYDKNENKILVCNTRKKAFWFQI